MSGSTKTTPHAKSRSSENLDMGQLYPVLIEQTAKKFKRTQVIGVLILLPSLFFLLMGLYLLSSGNRFNQDWGAIIVYSTLPFMVAGIGVSLYAYARAWWNHR